ncbi:P-loop containing nucleoside triphosphate hydrolase protein [Blyttiomyces helicus]|uniref:Elongation factor 3 n=1 Tax=Blyttiomyces helicus TaxID=388810 RepID=A0A4P9WIF4_9FUNG|nr:P-loop containing nucleoside triphosphate hydrolase protein [Blyttiomyces helicus]|eukprot:RKO91663.1 P-loop containing nucleoside triphosphate hydrolase protein [Blyttiomyces helicus]
MTKAASVDPKTVTVVSGLLNTITTSTSSEERWSAAQDLAGTVKSAGFAVALTQCGIFEAAKVASEHKKSAIAREGSASIFSALVEALGHQAEPYLIPQLPIVFSLLGDKSAEVRSAGEAALEALLALPGRFAVKLVVPILLEQLTNEKKWQSKVAALRFLGNLSGSFASQIAAALPEIIPAVSTTMWDTKPEVKSAATDAMNKVTATIDNIDVTPFLPALISCIARPEEVPECVYKLAATTFVTQVEAPTLAIMVPLLVRGLSERKPAVLRQTAVIIDNMCKLVENPADAHQFLPLLVPGLERIIEIAADPELRNVAAIARATLIRVGGGADLHAEDPAAVAKRLADARDEVIATFSKTVKSVGGGDIPEAVVSYIASQITAMYDSHVFSLPDWHHATVPFTAPFIGEEAAKKLGKPLLEHYHEMDKARQVAVVVDEDEGEELCNCEFSLAYGGMILLNNTKLRLTRGQRYGLCGPNGAGKSTLMRAIANGQLDGFPPADELKTVFVEHNLQAEEADLSVLDFVLTNPEFLAKKDEVLNTLKGVGFDDERLAQAVGTLSGGWKMKLELARAMLENADILLLDEPTNHLDVTNVAWLINYLTSLTNFVEARPEAKSYYELEETNQKFVFPEPGFLEGIKSKDKAILKMIHVDFTYPGTDKQILFDVSLQCSLNSRVAVIGPNGAGKSTAIKLLTGEMVHTTGDIWKHPNLRVAYVAQHAFHHVEQHLDKTPNEYIRWRYQYGEDREALVKATRQLTPEEEAAMKKPVVVEGEKHLFEELQGRRKAKRSYEYEVKWLNEPFDNNAWVSREKLEDWGFAKIVQWFDEKEAAKEGMYTRPLTAKNVEKHLEDVGLPNEFASHSRIRGLSGGQKVKVVLGAAMWNNPHMLVLDEPTNYLDRDSLGALAGAIKEFGGGVVIISHAREFTSLVCPEVWAVDAGRLTITGAKTEMKLEKIEMKEQETVTDQFGNVSKVKSTRKLTRKELKAKEKRRAAKIKAGEVPSDSEDDE